MDYDVFKAINDFTAGHDGFRHAMTGYVKASEVLFAGLILLLFFAVGRHGELWARRAAVAGVLSSTIALAIALTSNIRPLTPSPADRPTPRFPATTLRPRLRSP